MARLGEILVGAGLLTTDQLEQALRAQVMWGARLGTNLIELGFVDLDALSSALSQQHGMPAALARHFEKVDRELQLLLSPDLAQRFNVLPLLRVGDDRRIVLATTGPLSPKALALIADELFVEPPSMILAIAAELRVRYQLERIYGIQRGSRFMRAPDLTRQSFHNIRVEDVAESDVEIPITELAERALTTPFAPVEQEYGDDDLLEPTIERGPMQVAQMLRNLDDFPAANEDELAVPTTIEQEPSSGKERRRYVRTIADGPPDRESVPIPIVREESGSGPIEGSGALGRIALKKVAKRAESVVGGNTLDEMMRSIRRATARDKVAELVIDALFRFMPVCRAATILVVRGTIATSWKGFCRSGAPEAEVSVPLDQPCLVARAVDRNATTRGAIASLSPLDQMLIASLGVLGDLAVVPVTISGHVLCTLAMVVDPGAATQIPESIAGAAGSAFARLMRDASR